MLCVTWQGFQFSAREQLVFTHEQNCLTELLYKKNFILDGQTRQTIILTANQFAWCQTLIKLLPQHTVRLPKLNLSDWDDCKLKQIIQCLKLPNNTKGSSSYSKKT